MTYNVFPALHSLIITDEASNVKSLALFISPNNLSSVKSAKHRIEVRKKTIFSSDTVRLPCSVHVAGHWGRSYRFDQNQNQTEISFWFGWFTVPTGWKIPTKTYFDVLRFGWDWRNLKSQPNSFHFGWLFLRQPKNKFRLWFIRTKLLIVNNGVKHLLTRYLSQCRLLSMVD